jgi:FkbM family methyltransferase
VTLERVRYLAREVRTYARETRTPADFVRLMRIRLSQSKVGPLVCRRPIASDIDLPRFGGPIRLRSHTTDISVLSEVLVCHAYDTVPDHAGEEVASVVDLGANIGLTARWMAARWPDSSIVCVEPEPGNAALLRRNVEPLNGSVHVVEACVGAEERRVGLASTSGEHGFAMTDGETGLMVDVVTMERVLQGLPAGEIDILKCDIEGAERELFASCRPWIGRVRVAVVECHNGFRGDELVALLEANGGRFDVLHNEVDPGYGLETVTLRRTTSLSD